MPRHNFNDLLALITVAKERSFTRAAARLGVTQSALSHSIRSFEARLGVRLLTRTTRSVSTIDAGEWLIRSLVPKFEEIEADLSAVAELGERPAGTTPKRPGVRRLKRRAAAMSRLAVSRKSTVWPSRSTARYRYFHWPLTLM